MKMPPYNDSTSEDIATLILAALLIAAILLATVWFANDTGVLR